MLTASLERGESSTASGQTHDSCKKQKKIKRKKSRKISHLQRRVVSASPVPVRRGALAREFLDQGRVVAERSIVLCFEISVREKGSVSGSGEEEKGRAEGRPGRHRFFLSFVVVDREPLDRLFQFQRPFVPSFFPACSLLTLVPPRRPRRLLQRRRSTLRPHPRRRRRLRQMQRQMKERRNFSLNP